MLVVHKEVLSEPTYLIVDQAPLFKKRMHPHDPADIPRQIPPTSRHSEIFSWIQSIRVDHEISVILVYRRRLAAIPTREEFR